MRRGLKIFGIIGGSLFGGCALITIAATLIAGPQAGRTPTPPPSTATQPAKLAPIVLPSDTPAPSLTPIPSASSTVPASPTTMPTATRTTAPTDTPQPTKPPTPTQAPPSATVPASLPAAAPTVAPAVAPTASAATGCPGGCTAQKPGCDIKGNINDGQKIYHVPGGASYKATVIDPAKGERWFCTREEAQAAGWRAAQN